MARKVITYTVDPAGPERDRGKAYVITEMPASQAERWAIRAVLALTNSGLEIPDEIADGGMAAVAQLGIRIFGRVSFHDAMPLLDEMFSCVSRLPDASKPQVTRPLIEDDIEEVATRLLLRAEIWELHTGFSLGAALLK